MFKNYGVSILCLFVTIHTSYSMESSTTHKHDHSILPSADFIEQFNYLLAQKNEQALISWVTQNSKDALDNLSYIVEKAFERHLLNLLQCLTDLFPNQKAIFIKNAFNVQNISWIKNYTHFEKYIEGGDILKDRLYCADNQCDPSVLNAIVASTGINYRDSQGIRFLQKWIRNKESGNLIINFVNKASVEQLSLADEHTGDSALLAATVAWDGYKFNNNDMGMNEYLYIIKLLLKKGVNPSLGNFEHVRPIDFEFFKVYARECAEWEAEALHKPALTNNSLKVPKFTSRNSIINSSKKINYKIVGTIALISLAASYLVYRLNYKIPNQAVCIE